MTALGNLVRVDPRTVWTLEAGEFAPLLVENIDHLGEIPEVEVVERDANVGAFLIDFLARDLGQSVRKGRR